MTVAAMVLAALVIVGCTGGCGVLMIAAACTLLYLWWLAHWPAKVIVEVTRDDVVGFDARLVHCDEGEFPEFAVHTVREEGHGGPYAIAYERIDVPPDETVELLEALDADEHAV